MKKVDRIHIPVISSKQRYDFLFTIHRSELPEDHQIEDEFYGKHVPQGLHLEAEIDNVLELDAYPNRGKLHTHPSKKTGKQYVCWVGQIAKDKQMLDMLTMWCVGTVYTIEHGIQFEKIVEEKGVTVSDFDACRSLFESLGIRIMHTHSRFRVPEEGDGPSHHFQTLP